MESDLEGASFLTPTGGDVASRIVYRRTQQLQLTASTVTELATCPRQSLWSDTPLVQWDYRNPASIRRYLDSHPEAIVILRDAPQYLTCFFGFGREARLELVPSWDDDDSEQLAVLVKTEHWDEDEKRMTRFMEDWGYSALVESSASVVFDLLY
jgi:hypothetical protein